MAIQSASIYGSTGTARQVFPTAAQMPLAMVQAGETVHILSIRGKDETRRFLNNLGFVEGTEVVVVSELSGNMIVSVKGTRVAISKSMDNRVLTQE